MFVKEVAFFPEKPSHVGRLFKRIGWINGIWGNCHFYGHPKPIAFYWTRSPAFIFSFIISDVLGEVDTIHELWAMDFEFQMEALLIASLKLRWQKSNIALMLTSLSSTGQ